MDREMNMDLGRRAAVDAPSLAWVARAPGVLERLFERSTMAGLRETFLLSLAPGASTPAGEPQGGMDVFVVQGSLVEGAERYARGTYLGLPEGDRPVLATDVGATLFVKRRPSLRRHRVVVRTQHAVWQRAHSPGLFMLRLDDKADARVVLLRFDAGVALSLHEHEEGEEFFVLEGSLRDEAGTYGPHSWVRQPPSSAHSVVSETGCVLLTTAGHLSLRRA